jgi:hypothetical protein
MFQLGLQWVWQVPVHMGRKLSGMKMNVTVKKYKEIVYTASNSVK